MTIHTTSLAANRSYALLAGDSEQGPFTSLQTISVARPTLSTVSAAALDRKVFKIEQISDTTLPTIQILSPSQDSVLSGSVAVSVAATDNAGVAAVDYSLDGRQLATVSAAPFGFNWNTLSAADGSHVLKATARDAANNTASAQITIVIDNVPDDTVAPVISIDSPPAGSSVSGKVAVKVTASDNVGVKRVELWVDGKLTVSSARAPFKLSWNTMKAAQGAHTLLAKAYDAAGNVGLSQPVTVYKGSAAAAQSMLRAKKKVRAARHARVVPLHGN